MVESEFDCFLPALWIGSGLLIMEHKLIETLVESNLTILFV